MENFLSSNEVYTIDLSASNTPADVVFELSQYLDDSKSFGKKIYLKLPDIDLSKAQLLSLKSLISSINSTLAYIESPSEITVASAQAIYIDTPNNAPVQEQQNQNETFVEENNNIQETIENVEVVVEEDNNNNQEITENSEDDIQNIEPFEEQQVQDFSPAEIKAKEYINLDMLNNNDNQKEILPPPPIQQTYQQKIFEETPENSFEQQLDDFSPRNQEENLEDFAQKEEIVEIAENPDQQKLPFENKIEEDIYKEDLNSRENVLESIEQSVEFDKLADETNFQKEDVKDALDGIFATEQKLENILDDTKEKLTVELFEPLDTTYTEEDAQIEKMNVKYIKQTIRSGNVISSDGNLVIIGDCHPGSELHAAGDITVWGMLGGIAHAGNKGNKKAKVRALKLNPIQLRIANLYSRRPDSLHTIYVEKTATFTPEEARILNDEIIIYTMNEK